MDVDCSPAERPLADELVPTVSVIIPLYESQATLGACLRAVGRQTFHDFEVILVDSSPGDAAATVRRETMPRALYLRAGRRLRPQAARNLGAQRARGTFLAFTDPDIYPTAQWLERLVAASRERQTAVVLGSIACHGRRWLDRGVHLCKFNICLPGGRARPVPLGWSGNVLVTRRFFESLGGFPEGANQEGVTQADSIFTARARASGDVPWFEPEAVVEHDHEGVGFTDFIQERYWRGREFAEIEAAGNLDPGHSPATSPRRRSGRVLISIPLRVVNRIVFVGRAAAESHLQADYWLTLPVVLSGVIAWYAGMGTYHWRRLTRGGRPLSQT